MTTLDAPGRVAIDGAGNAWIADTGNGRVIAVDWHGGGHGGVISVAGEFAAPQGMSVAADGRAVYVADPGAGAIYRIDLAGPMVAGAVAGAVVDAVVTAAGDLPEPWAVACDDEAGTLYVAMAGADQIWTLDIASAGAAQPGPWPEFARPTGLALSPDRRRLYVVDNRPPAVRQIDLVAGDVTTLAALPGGESRDARGPDVGADVVLTPSGLAVAHPASDHIYGVNTRHGTVVAMSRALSLSRPGGVAFERASRSYLVADTGNDRIVRIPRDFSTSRELTLE